MSLGQSCSWRSVRVLPGCREQTHEPAAIFLGQQVFQITGDLGQKGAQAQQPGEREQVVLTLGASPRESGPGQALLSLTAAPGSPSLPLCPATFSSH